MGGFATTQPIGYSSRPFDLAGYSFDAPPQSTLTSRLTGEEEVTATRSTAAEIIQSIGNIILGGIVLTRTPVERLPQPATAPNQVQAGTSAQQAGQVQQSPIDLGMLAFVGLLIVALFFIFRATGAKGPPIPGA